MTTTYTINCTDTDRPTPWHDAPGIVSATPGNQDSGRCRWTVVTADPDALEAALDADDAVIEYDVVDAARPCGDVEWDRDKTYGYVACVYGDDGDQPGDCYLRVGQDEAGRWWIDDGDDDVRTDVRGPHVAEGQARAAAAAAAKEQDESDGADDAADLAERRLRERAGEPDPDGAWCVWWETVGDDSHPEERYATRDAAEAAAELAQQRLEQSHPGGGLLCGYTVRRLADGRWVEAEVRS